MNRKPPKFPVYDRAKNGNPFQWILAQSAALHDKQRARCHAAAPAHRPADRQAIPGPGQAVAVSFPSAAAFAVSASIQSAQACIMSRRSGMYSAWL